MFGFDRASGRTRGKRGTEKGQERVRDWGPETRSFTGDYFHFPSKIPVDGGSTRTSTPPATDCILETVSLRDQNPGEPGRL